MADRRDGRSFSQRPARRTSSRSPRGLTLREARPRREREGRRAKESSRSRSTAAGHTEARGRGGEQDSRRDRLQSPHRERARSRSRRQAPNGNHRTGRRENLPHESRNEAGARSPASDSESPSRSPAKAPARKRRAGFDQKEMLPENYAMQQLTALLPKGQPVSSVPKFNPRRIWDTLPTTVTHVNPEVEAFLLINPVETHAATRLRALPPHFQSIVLERGSIFGSRDKTAVLMSRIKDVCRGVTDPYAFLYKPGQDLSGIPMANGTSGTATSSNVQSPGSNEAVLASSQPAASSGFSGVASKGGESKRGGGGSSATAGAPLALRDASPRDPPVSEQSELDSRKHHSGEFKRKPIVQAGLEVSESYCQDGSTPSAHSTKASKASPATKASKRKQPNESTADEPVTKNSKKSMKDEACGDKPESEDQRKKREEMQSSIAATLASLSTKVLGKDKAKLEGLVKASGASASKSLCDAADQDTERDKETSQMTNSGSQTEQAKAVALPGTQTRLSAPALPNPFRSKPHAAPVFQEQESTAPDEPAMMIESPLLKTAFNQSQADGSPPWTAATANEALLPKQVFDTFQAKESITDCHSQETGLHGPTEAPWHSSESTVREPEAARPTTDQMEVAKIPRGLQALRLQKGSAAAGSGAPTQIDLQPRPGIADKTQQEQRDWQPSATPAISDQLPHAGPPQETFEEKKKRVQATAKRAYALAALINYGLTDPDDEADLSKAVHAMASATGDHKMAVTMWQQVTGKEPAQQMDVATEVSNASDDLQNLPDQQQSELQQAAAAAQYSQLWMQQQFLSQMTLFEGQWRGTPSVDTPAVCTVSEGGEASKAGAKGKGRSDVDKKNAWQMMLPGDWKCPGCGDHQFARNRTCRYCGTAKPL